MRFTINVTAGVTLLAIALGVSADHHTKSSCLNGGRNETLDTWFTNAVIGHPGCLGLFPNQTGWEDGFDRAFARNVTSSFGPTLFDFKGFLNFTRARNTRIMTTFSLFTVDFTSLVTIPNPNDLGGLVVVTALETGVPRAGGELHKAMAGVFAVVSEIHGERKFTEWREASD